ncbi:uncharacterized protein V1516DRAFT_675629 [Lipomyces oligophaga]|uniref:uncharacterized protein n=1 Tax=Lipomyces oligophaga TaxID=45792 RepID=UPI0034CDA7FB
MPSNATRAADTLARARSLRQRGKIKDALDAAILACEQYLDQAQSASSSQTRKEITENFNQAAELAESLKLLDISHSPPKAAVTHVAALGTSGNLELSKLEQKIILKSSRIGNRIFPPWTIEDSKLEPSQSPFTDKDGFLTLSPEQNKYFNEWKRIYDLYGEHAVLFPTDKYGIDRLPFDLSQDVLPDCSIVASLCAALHWESRTDKKIISDLIHPNEVWRYGCYHVRLFINGVYRKVVIDDYMPTTSASRRIHVSSSFENRIYGPALVEKAYLKIMGGYNFPGSNAASDLFALTTWIPEHILLHEDEIDISSLWTRLKRSWDFSDVLVTIGTGELKHEEEKLYGLVRKHDYAVLEVRVSDNAEPMILVKNPWSNTHEDVHLKSDPETLDAANGCFWMTFAQACMRFNSLYLNWNPQLFKYKYESYFVWDMKNGLAKNSLASCPQFAVRNISAKETQIWILLCKHFTTISKDRNFIALYVIKEPGIKALTKKSTAVKSKLVDSSQTLVRFTIPGKTAYTVVAAAAAQNYEMNSFSLLTYSTLPLKISAVDEGPFVSAASGQWTEMTAGGNVSNASFAYNPQFQLSVTSNCRIQIFVETDASATGSAVHAQIIWGKGQRVHNVRPRDIVLDTGEYKIGSSLSKPGNINQGTYTIVVSLYEPGIMGEFKLRVMSNCACQIVRIPDLRDI